MQLMVRNIQTVVFAFILSGCVGLPAGIQPVEQFELNRYLGQWYEIARLDHAFERGLDKVTAEYTLRADGGVKVINRGLSSTDNEWKEAEGKAYFVRDADEGYFKVSFFGPFYGAYVIFELDKEQYQYAFVAGNDRSYLWLLARTPRVSDELIQRFGKRAEELGFATDNLIYVKQN